LSAAATPTYAVLVAGGFLAFLTVPTTQEREV
jgi:hypothetical protein